MGGELKGNGLVSKVSSTLTVTEDGTQNHPSPPNRVVITSQDKSREGRGTRSAKISRMDVFGCFWPFFMAFTTLVKYCAIVVQNGKSIHTSIPILMEATYYLIQKDRGAIDNPSRGTRGWGVFPLSAAGLHYDPAHQKKAQKKIRK